jgi:hypothetical protein
MIDFKVIICSIVRNIDNYIDNSLILCLKTAQLFKESKIIIYENNSIDRTKLILDKFKCSSRFKIINEDLNDDYMKNNNKLEQITNARNKLIDEIRQPIYNDFHYVIMIDLNTVYWSIENIGECFKNYLEWDVIYGNEINKYGSYYNKYSFRDFDNFLFGPELIGYNSWNKKKYINLEPNRNLIPILSGFGGIGIYKKEVFDRFNYKCQIDDTIIDFYISILKEKYMTIDKDIIKLIENPIDNDENLITTYLYNDETKYIYWKNNSEYISEHVYLNIHLYLNKYRVFIHNKLLYKKC